MRTESEKALIDLMYRGTTTVRDLQWDNMTTVPLLQLMTFEDINYLRKLILSPRYAGNNKLKLKKMDELMHFRGFTKFAGGTNRIVYTHPSAPGTVFKVAIDSIGINDNPAEFRNQFLLKPYCCKVFECSPCGTIASFEMVDRISTFEEFYTIADDYFYLLSRVILGKYVMEDIGIDYFMNIGIRKGFGVVLLDFPYLFELDGRKLKCSRILDDGTICCGEVDYDHGFNKLICNRCGKLYRARDLSKLPENGGVIVHKKGKHFMRIRIMQDDECLKEVTTQAEKPYLTEADKKTSAKKYNCKTKMVVKVLEDGMCVSETTVDPPVNNNRVRVVEKKPKFNNGGKQFQNNRDNNKQKRVISKPVVNTHIESFRDRDKRVTDQINSRVVTNIPAPAVVKSKVVESTTDDKKEETSTSPYEHKPLPESFEEMMSRVQKDRELHSSTLAQIISEEEDDTTDNGTLELNGIVFVENLPEYDNAVKDVVYCVRLDDSINVDEYNDKEYDDITLIDPSLFDIYVKDVDSRQLVQYNVDPETKTLSICNNQK